MFTIRVNAQAKIEFKNQKQNFGFVKKGELVKLEYVFTNTGDQPLLITESKIECTCTTVELPTAPILPGKTGLIILKFDTSPTYDRQDRAVEIISNAKGSPHKIRYKGVVLVK